MDTHMKRALGAVTTWDTFKRMTETQSGFDTLLPGHPEHQNSTTPPQHHMMSSPIESDSDTSPAHSDRVNLSAAKPSAFVNGEEAKKGKEKVDVDEVYQQNGEQFNGEEHSHHHKEHHHHHERHHNGINGFAE
jgi:alpha,alpha-trehalase